MTSPTEPQGMRRRSVLKRSALIGGTVVWTTPLVQSIAAPALAETGSPIADCADISYVIVLFQCDGKYYAWKFEGEEGYDPVYVTFVNGQGKVDTNEEAFERMFTNIGLSGSGVLEQTEPDPVPFTYSGNASGDLIVNVTPGSSCLVISFTVHDGQAGDGPDNNYTYLDPNPPAGWVFPTDLPTAGEVTFVKPGEEDLACAESA